jgi:hypothetical protein
MNEWELFDQLRRIEIKYQVLLIVAGPKAVPPYTRDEYNYDQLHAEDFEVEIRNYDTPSRILVYQHKEVIGEVITGK